MLLGTNGRNSMNKLKTEINSSYLCKDKGPIGIFLNLHFVRDRLNRTISVSAPTKVSKLLLGEGLLDIDKQAIAKPAKLPASPNLNLVDSSLSRDQPSMLQRPYKSILGQLLYLAITCRPDIATAVSQAGKYASNPGVTHWSALLHIVRYIQGTRRYTLTLGGNEDSITLNAFSDSDWAGDLDKRRSRTGYVVRINNSPIIWSSKLQVSVALSSAEAEYVALAATARDVLFCRNMLEELGFAQNKATTIYEDNNSCIAIAEGQKSHSGVKHINLRHHFIKDAINDKQVILERKDTSQMTADILTKNLPQILFDKHRLGLRVTQSQQDTE